MPSRSIIIGIVVFWLTAMGWMFYRETWPRIAAGEPPPLYFDLHDEVGRDIRWELLKERRFFKDGIWMKVEKRMGFLDTHSKRQPDQTYRLSAAWRLDKPLTLPAGFSVQKVFHTLHVNLDGELLSSTTRANIRVNTALWECKLRHQVKGKKLHTQVWIRKDPLPFKIKPIDLPPKHRVVNTMHPLHKIPGLTAGMSWALPTFNLVEAVVKANAPDTILNKLLAAKVPKLLANVESESLTWYGEAYSCWRIDYGEAGQKPIAHTWVRKRDGLVLQQKAKFHKYQFVYRRTKKNR